MFTVAVELDLSSTKREDRKFMQVNPLTPTVAITDTAIKHHVPDQVKPSFVIFDIRAR